MWKKIPRTKSTFSTFYSKIHVLLQNPHCRWIFSIDFNQVQSIKNILSLSLLYLFRPSLHQINTQSKRNAVLHLLAERERTDRLSQKYITHSSHIFNLSPHPVPTRLIPDMASQTQGIQQLLAAEKRAAEKVAEARKSEYSLCVLIE